MKINQMLSYIILTTILVTSLTIINVTGLAHAQIYPQRECGQVIEEEFTFPEVDPGFNPYPNIMEKFLQRSLSYDYRNGCGIGTALGSAHGISDGYNDRVAERDGHPNNNYMSPSETDVCALFEDLYERECVVSDNFVSSNNSNALDFMEGYFDAYPIAYTAGYYTGYYLDKVIDQRYTLDEPDSVKGESIEPNSVEEKSADDYANLSISGGNHTAYSRWWRSPY